MCSIYNETVTKNTSILNKLSEDHRHIKLNLLKSSYQLTRVVKINDTARVANRGFIESMGMGMSFVKFNITRLIHHFWTSETMDIGKLTCKTDCLLITADYQLLGVIKLYEKSKRHSGSLSDCISITQICCFLLVVLFLYY